MPRKQYVMQLSAEERKELGAIVTKQRGAAQRYRRARILLRADQGPDGPGETDAVIATALGIPPGQVERVRAWAAEVGPIQALERRPSPQLHPRRLDGRGEAQLIALTRSDPPAGRAQWTLQLLADRLVELKVVDAIDDNTVGRVLKKIPSSHT